MSHCTLVCGKPGGHRHHVASLLVSYTLLVVALSPAAANEDRKSTEENSGWVLAHHSFEKTLSYDDRLGDWLASAGTMALRDRVQILPPVPDRYGLFWNKKAAKTRNFKVTFNFRVFPHQDSPRTDGTFAFWLSPDNFSTSYNEQTIVNLRNWTLGLEQTGLTFISNKPSFRGIAVIFLALDKEGGAKPSVSAVMCDGNQPHTLADFPAKEESQAGALQTKFVNWLEKDVEVSIHAMLGGVVTGTLKTSKSPEVEIFRLPVEDTAAWQDAFFGFSGWTGSKSYLEVDMSRVETRNFDTKQIGEEVPAEKDELLNEVEDPEKWKELLEAEKRYIDQRSQKEAVDRLTKLLSEYVDKYNKMGEKVNSELVWLEKRVQSLDSDINLLVGTSKAVNPKTGDVDTSTLLEHIVGIRSILHNGNSEHDHKFQQVHASAKSLKAKGGDVLGPEGRVKVASVADQAKAVEQNVASGTTQSGFLLMILVLAVCVLGILFLNRMRYYEKKHYI